MAFNVRVANGRGKSWAKLRRFVVHRKSRKTTEDSRSGPAVYRAARAAIAVANTDEDSGDSEW